MQPLFCSRSYTLTPMVHAPLLALSVLNDRVAGLLNIPRNFPKVLFVRLYEAGCRNDPDNIHVVSYRPPKHAVRRWASYSPYLHGPVKALHFMASYVYSDLEDVAEVIVEVPVGSITAVARRNPRWKPAAKRISLLWYYHHELLVAGVLALSYWWTHGRTAAGTGSTPLLATLWTATAALYGVLRLIFR